MTVSIVTCVNDRDLYNANFIAREVPPKTQIIPVYGAESAAAGLNEGVDRAVHNIVVCCHQDTYLPDGWVDVLRQRITELDDADFGVLGTFGVDMDGNYAGNIRQPNGDPKMGDLPCLAQSLDEHCLIIRKSSGLRFDEELGGFHMYGADICLQAMERGMKNYAIDAYLEHMSNGKGHETFFAMADKFCDKWQKIGCLRIAVRTTCGVFLLRTGKWMNATPNY